MLMVFFNFIVRFVGGIVQRFMIDVVHREFDMAVSRVPQGSMLGLLLFLLFLSDLPIILENTLVGFADGSTL